MHGFAKLCPKILLLKLKIHFLFGFSIIFSSSVRPSNENLKDNRCCTVCFWELSTYRRNSWHYLPIFWTNIRTTMRQHIWASIYFALKLSPPAVFTLAWLLLFGRLSQSTSHLCFSFWCRFYKFSKWLDVSSDFFAAICKVGAIVSFLISPPVLVATFMFGVEWTRIGWYCTILTGNNVEPTLHF